MKNKLLRTLSAPVTATGRAPDEPQSGDQGSTITLIRSAWLAAVLAASIGLAFQPTFSRAQQEAAADQDAQVLTRGPVHEAFAGVVTFNPEPGVVVPKAPPEAIEELPPAERPEGDNVTWIPGYWAWDDEHSDFLWVSGIWRALPPGRQWIAGYWGQVNDGYQWTSGYWAETTAKETTYLPKPPATIENGPNIAAPSNDYSWTPGCWIWRQQRYAWQPGYWARCRADWTWMPAHYMWTPRGYIFVDGYWDYGVARRGVVFAPVAFGPGIYGRPGYSYSPSVVIDVALIVDQLFLRPNYHHYYFGDYYAPSYHQGGYCAAYAYQANRIGYDPFYAHRRWEHRMDKDWDRRVMETYEYRRDHENARPPRTWAALKNLDPKAVDTAHGNALVATPIDQLAKKKDGPQRFETLAADDRKKLAKHELDVQKVREQRRTLETAGAAVSNKPGEPVAPLTAKLPQSSIAGKSPKLLKKSEMPPEVPKVPKADLKVATNTDTLKPKPELVPGDKKLVPGDKKLVPGDKKIGPDTHKTDIVPKKKDVIPGADKPEITPKNKKDIVPITPKPEFVPKKKKDVVPDAPKSEFVPKKKDVVPATPKPEFVPKKKDIVPDTPKKKDLVPATPRPEAMPRDKGPGRDGEGDKKDKKDKKDK